MHSISVANVPNEVQESPVPFENIQVSTQTFTVKSNILDMNLEKFFDKIPLCKNNEAEIINMKFQLQKKGVFEIPQSKKRISRKKAPIDAVKQRNFLNCISIVMIVDKKINIKIFKNGVFQITGCRKQIDVTRCINLIFEQLRLNIDVFTLRDRDTDFIILIKSAMRNIDFSVNYKIDRSILSNYLRSHTKYNAPPLSSTNMGVKMKIPFDIHDLPITRIVYHGDQQVVQDLLLRDCIDELEPNKTRQKAKFENKFNNATIFQNGKVLMSCVDETFQREYYYWIANILIKNKKLFQLPEHVKKSFRLI